MKRQRKSGFEVGRILTVFAALLVALSFLCLDTVARTKSPAHQEGRDYYVAPSGKDNWSGSSKRPWQTLDRAARSVHPGDTVHVADGVYESPRAITTLTSGNPGARIRFVSDKKWGAKLTTTARGFAFVWLNKGDYVDIEGFDVSCPACSIGIRNMGSNVRIIGNHVHDIPGEPECTSNGGAGINNGNYSAYDNDVIGNVVHNIGPARGTCNKIHGFYHSNLRGRIWNNIVYGNSAWGITTWHAANAEIIANNTVFENGAVSPEGKAFVGGGILIGAGDDPGNIVNDDAVVANNIIYRNGGIGLREYGRVGDSNRYHNNLIFANGLDTMLLRKHKAEGTIQADPQFVKYTGSFFTGDYRLKPTSPALRAGKRDPAPGEDFERRTRQGSGPVDLGAYERSAASQSPAKTRETSAVTKKDKAR